MSNDLNDKIRILESQLEYILPETYTTLLAESNSNPEKDFLTVYPLEKVYQLNQDYKINEFLPGALLIGNDGGDEAVVVDLRQDSDTRGSFYFVSFIPLEWKEAKLAGKTLSEITDFYKLNLMSHS